MRVVLHSVLREGMEAGYEQAHARVPDELAAALRRAGITDWTIWRSGRHLVHLVECVDFGAAMSALADDSADQRWQAFIGEFVDHFEPAGAAAPLPQVWSLADQP